MDNNPNIPWLDQDSTLVPSVQHPFPKHLDKLIPKFKPDNKEPAENHIAKFILVVKTMNFQH